MPLKVITNCSGTFESLRQSVVRRLYAGVNLGGGQIEYLT